MGGSLMTKEFIVNLTHFFGYRILVIMKDAVVLSAGVSIGLLIMLFLCSNFLYRIESVDDLGKVTAVTLYNNEEKRYYTSITSFYQAVEFIIQVTLLPFIIKKSYTVHNERRTRLITYTLFMLCAILIILAILFIEHPLI